MFELGVEAPVCSKLCVSNKGVVTSTERNCVTGISKEAFIHKIWHLVIQWINEKKERETISSLCLGSGGNFSQEQRSREKSKLTGKRSSSEYHAFGVVPRPPGRLGVTRWRWKCGGRMLDP